jgi:Pectate lyase superfamily protein
VRVFARVPVVKGCFLWLLLAHGFVCVRGDIIPADRRIDWSPGIPGGIRNYTSLINVRNAPYNAKGDGITDDTAAIQSALNAAQNGQVVYLPTGTYNVSSTLSWANKQIVLRGDGPAATRIISSAYGNLIYINTSSDRGSWIGITAGFQKGATALTLTSGSGFSVGDFIIISQLNDSSFVSSGGNEGCPYCSTDNDGQHVMTQIARVVSKTNNTLYLNRPLYFNLSPSLSPVVRRTGLYTQYSGVENLYVEGTSRTRDDQGANILFNGAAYCWITNVTSKYAGGANFRLRMCYACEISGSWVNDSYDHSSSHDYGISLLWPNSDHLIQNNIAQRCRHSFCFEAGGSGVVFAYNYSVDPVSDDLTWLSEDMMTHGAHPLMNLFEGNIFAKLGHDFIHGSSSHNTTFRSWVFDDSAATTKPTAGRWAVDIMDYNYSNNVVGCVIGKTADSGFRYLSNNQWQPAAYRLGFETGGGTTITDPTIVLKTLIHGNYDYFGLGMVWDAATLDHTLPASLYLTSKPAYFGNLKWPPFDPTKPTSNAITNLPAGYRYVFGVAPPAAAQPASLGNPSRTQSGWVFNVAGTPGTSYQIWRATSLSGPWTNRASVTTDSRGIGSWTDTNAPPSRCFYRAVLP